jgi:hypothetical protein
MVLRRHTLPRQEIGFACAHGNARQAFMRDFSCGPFLSDPKLFSRRALLVVAEIYNSDYVNRVGQRVTACHLVPSKVSEYAPISVFGIAQTPRLPGSTQGAAFLHGPIN